MPGRSGAGVSTGHLQLRGDVWGEPGQDPPPLPEALPRAGSCSSSTTPRGSSHGSRRLRDPPVASRPSRRVAWLGAEPAQTGGSRETCATCCSGRDSPEHSPASQGAEEGRKRGEGSQGDTEDLGDPASQPPPGSQIPMGCHSPMATGQMFEAPAVLRGWKQQQLLQLDPRDVPRSPSAPPAVPDPPMGAEVTPGSAPRALQGREEGNGALEPGGLSLGQALRWGEPPQPLLPCWGSAPSIMTPPTLYVPFVSPQCVGQAPPLLFPTPMCSVPPLPINTPQ